jgi:hypothetical protein
LLATFADMSKTSPLALRWQDAQGQVVALM